MPWAPGPGHRVNPVKESETLLGLLPHGGLGEVPSTPGRKFHRVLGQSSLQDQIPACSGSKWPGAGVTVALRTKARATVQCQEGFDPGLIFELKVSLPFLIQIAKR